MNNEHNHQPPLSRIHSGAQHTFLVPEHAPFLEIRTTLNSPLPYAEHFHSAFSLGLILRGKTCFSVNGEKYTAEEGDIVLIAPGQTHSCNPLAGCVRSYHMLLIDEAWFTAHAGDIAGENGLHSHPGGLWPCKPVVQDAVLFREAIAMVEKFVSSTEGTTELIALLHRLHCRHNCFAAGDAPSPAVPCASEPHDWLCAVDEDVSPTVSGLADLAGIRRESFWRAVRRKTGLPPSRYLHCLRLEKGRQLLRLGKSIAEAAIAAGYADQSHFHRMFVKFYSATPGCYRHGMSHRYKKQPAAKE